jgi:hypothetical protein
MRKTRAGMLAVLLCAGFGWMSANAEGDRWLNVENVMGVGYDDNVSYSSTNKIDRVRFTNRLILSADRPTDTGFIGLRYALSYTQYDSEGELRDREHWGHQVDFDFTHSFSRQLTLGVRDTFFYTERPSIENPDGTLRKPEATYYYNTVNLNLSSYLTSRLQLAGSGRWQTLRYTEDDQLSEREDYDLYSAGLTLTSIAGKNSSIGADFRYDAIDYVSAKKAVDEFAIEQGPTTSRIPDRSWSGYSAGLVLNRIFAPTLMGSIRAGYMIRDYESASISSDDSPYGDISLTFMPVQTTRITAAAGYALYQSGLISYAGQTRTSASLSVSQDLTARMTATLLGSYTLSDYQAKTTVDEFTEEEIGDATEKALSFSANLAYRIGTRNWVQLSYSWTDFDSDIPRRGEYTRNTYDISWRIRL